MSSWFSFPTVGGDYYGHGYRQRWRRRYYGRSYRRYRYYSEPTYYRSDPCDSWY